MDTSFWIIAWFMYITALDARRLAESNSVTESKREQDQLDPSANHSGISSPISSSAIFTSASASASCFPTTTSSFPSANSSSISPLRFLPLPFVGDAERVKFALGHSPLALSVQSPQRGPMGLQIVCGEENGQPQRKRRTTGRAHVPGQSRRACC